MKKILFWMAFLPLGFLTIIAGIMSVIADAYSTWADNFENWCFDRKAFRLDEPFEFKEPHL